MTLDTKTLPKNMVAPNIEESGPDTELSNESLIAWMKKIHDGMNIMHRGNVATNNALERVLEELINLRNDVDDIKREL